MMSRHRHHRKVNTFALSVLFLAAWILVFIYGTRVLGRESLQDQHDALENALSRDITSCYALEGSYPPDLQYLEDHYGLTYDRDLFFVDYRPIASNIRPDFFIIDLQDGEGGSR